MKYVATCTPGLEEPAIEELKEKFGIKSEVLHKGGLLFKGNERDMFRLNFLSKTLHRIILLLGETTVETLDDIYNFVKRHVEIEKYISNDQTFGVKSNRHGDHNFTSLDISRYVGQAIIDRYNEIKGKRLKVNLSNPDIRIIAELRDRRFWIGIDTTGESLHKRWYRKFTHITSLRSSIAYSMVHISDFKKELYDPLCGTGMIPIEAYHYKTGKPNLYRNFSFEKFSWIDLREFENLKEEYSEKKFEGVVFASDWNKDVVLKAFENSREAEADVKFFVNDIRRFIPSVESIVTDLPYGIRMKKYDLKKFYRRFFESVYGKFENLVFVTALKSLKFFPKKMELDLERKYVFKYGDIDAIIFVAKS